MLLSLKEMKETGAFQYFSSPLELSRSLSLMEAIRQSGIVNVKDRELVEALVWTLDPLDLFHVFKKPGVQEFLLSNIKPLYQTIEQDWVNSFSQKIRKEYGVFPLGLEVAAALLKGLNQAREDSL
jgi:hypothetical protein